MEYMRLKEIREENNLKQIEVANILKVSRSVYGMWEVEQDIIPLRRLNDFCNEFNVSFDYILELTDIKNYPNSHKDIDINKLKVRLTTLRKNAKLTQDKLSQKLEITRSLISKYEHSTNLILTSYLLEYSKYFNISSDYLIGKIDYIPKLNKTIKS
jgi:transcriptional regulator with XRE-family HTH domain